MKGAKNYCRNFAALGRPWCFTIHEHIVGEFCDLRICKGRLNLNLVKRNTLLYLNSVCVDVFSKHMVGLEDLIEILQDRGYT